MKFFVLVRFKIGRKIALLLIIIFFLSGCINKQSSRKVPPEAIDGVLDLSNWDFEKDGPIELKGDWKFKWKKLISPNQFQDKGFPLSDGLYSIPGIWNSKEDPSEKGKLLNGIGYASFFLKVKLPVSANGLGISLDWVSASHKLFIINPESSDVLIYNGSPGISAESSIPEWLPKVRNFNAGGYREIYLLWQISNFHTARGGPWESPILGNAEKLRDNLQFTRIRDAVLIGLLLIMGLYHLGLVIERPEDKGSLWFAIACLLIMLRQIGVGRFIPLFNPDADVDQFNFLLGMIYISMYLNLPSMGAFLNEIAPRAWYRRFVYLIAAVSLLHVLLLLTTSAMTSDAFLVSYEIITVVGAGGSFIHLIIEGLKGNKVARISLIGFFPLLASVLNDILVNLGVIDTIYLIHYGFSLFILAQSYVLATRFAAAYRTAEKLTRNLKVEVEKQTEELKIKTDAALTAKKEADSLRKRAEKQAEELAKLDQQKTAFFQNISHELRTPLTLILNPLESVNERYKSDQDIVVATKNAKRLLRLVNQLLDFQKIDAGKKVIDLKALDLLKFLKICGDYFFSACSTKNIDFSLSYNGNLFSGTEDRIWIMAELDALEKIAFNYLSNALKYTPVNGAIEFGLITGSNRVRLFVKDNGSGISEDGLEKLFQVFSQVDDSSTRSYEGSGLGLALVKSLAEQLGAEVGVSSELGEGSVFWVEFPVVDTNEADRENLDFIVKDWLLAGDISKTGEEDESDDDFENSGDLVLVVDDLRDMRDLIKKALKKKGYRVISATNGKRGLEKADENIPRLIITDWMMPEMTGPDLILKLKKHKRLHSVPVILLTAKSDEESKLIGTDIGADAFLGKPFNEQELTSIVRNLVSLKSREREVEELNRMLTETVLKRYIPPALVDRIISGEISMNKEAEMKTITVLFSDLSGFTKTSAALGPQLISEFLNEYLTIMNEIIFSHFGTIDKFIGDAIMVMFGAPEEMSPEEQVLNASRCAIKMQEVMTHFLKKWIDKGAGHLKMRIGLNRGEVIVGNFGSDKRSDYTCIGPEVNLAARIESVCVPGEVFASLKVCEILPDEAYEKAGEFELKGIDGKTDLYRLL